MAKHTQVGSGAPTTTPTELNQHYLDTVSGKFYFSKGTSSSADWLDSTPTTPVVLGPELEAIKAAGGSAAGRVPYYTGPGTASVAVFTVAGRNLVAGIDVNAQKTTLGLNNVQNLDQTDPSNIIQTPLLQFVTLAEKSDWDSKEPGVSGGTTSQYYRGDKSWQTLDKTAVGLSNIDNTSDLNKPISTATQTALNAKEPTVTAGTTAQYYRGDKFWAVLDKSAVSLSNVDNTSDLLKPISTATQNALNNKENTIAPGTTSQYWRGDKTWQTHDKASVGLGNVPNTDATARANHTGTQTVSTLSDFTTGVDARITLQKGAANGLVPLDGTSKIPAIYIPGSYDDVLEYANLAAFPVTGEAGKIYTAIDTNLTYRWSGSTYAVLNPSLALGETSTTAYRGDRGKTAYDHSQTTGNAHSMTKADISLGNVDNTSDLSKPISTATQTALNGKEATIAAGLTTQYWRGDKTWQLHDKASVGLGAVDNTSDLGKPISTATQTALNGKEATITGGTATQFWNGLKAWTTLVASHISDFTSASVTAAKTNLAVNAPPLQYLTDASWQGNSQEFARANHVHGFFSSGVLPGTYGDSLTVPTITMNSQGQVTAASETAIPDATTSVHGLMSAADKTKLDGIVNDVVLINSSLLTNSSNVTLVNISDLTMSMLDNNTYHFKIRLIYLSTANNTGIAFAFTGTAGGSFYAQASGNTSTGAASFQAMRTLNTVVTFTASPHVSPSLNILEIEGAFECTSPGTFIPQFRSETNGQTITILPKSITTYKEV